ncbi:MAG: L-rhamnose/proton symporter RhaT [Bacteroidota bacterium]
MNSFLGIILHSIGGIFHGSFYYPLTKVKNWKWESYWLLQGFFAWIISPVLVASFLVSNLNCVFCESSLTHLFYPVLFGFLWGLGSLTFGLTMRYLGMSLGMSIALGFCTSFGTIIPPIYTGNITVLFTTLSGWIILTGVMLCISGIAIVGYAGSIKERELGEKEKRKIIKEFALTKGILIAIFSGILSACFAFGLQAGSPVADIAVYHGTKPIFQNTPVFILIMGGGFIANFIFCLILSFKNKSYKDFFKTCTKSQALNYLYSICAGIMWYTGFFFYGMGTTFMGKYDFISWSIHMAAVIFFSNLCGILAKEWFGVKVKTIRLVYIGMLILIISTIIIGYGNIVQ